MRAAVPILALAAFLALGACNRTHSGAKVAISTADRTTAQAGPHLAAGLWRQRVADETGVSVTRYCLDDVAAAALASFNQELSGRCSERQMALSSDGAWHFRTICAAGGTGKVITEGTMRGDFASRYVVAATQASAGGASHVTADVRRLGDCPNGMKPGDVILPDGLHTRLSALPANT